MPFPPPGDLPDPGIKPVSPSLAGGFFPIEPPGKSCPAGRRPVLSSLPTEAAAAPAREGAAPSVGSQTPAVVPGSVFMQPRGEWTRETGAPGFPNPSL